jgi:hypothetical protein
MAYDTAMGQLVLFGGVGGSGVDNDTWTLTGTTWTELTPTTSPPAARYGATMAYDSATSQLVLFGGTDNVNYYSDTWTLTGTTWTDLSISPAASPPARDWAVMADDPGTHQFVLFGGVGNDGYLADTWTFGVATTTSLSVSRSSVSYGGETTEVTVTGANSTPPTGTVTIKNGSLTLCSTTAFTAKSADAVTATCSPSDTQLGVGTYPVSASYSGDDHYNGSTSEPASFSITKDTVTLTVSASRTTVTVGDESATIFTVTGATAHGEAVPNGTTVVVHIGSTTCVVSLTGGTGTCSIADSALPAGSYAVTASFGGTSDLSASALTSPTALSVVSAPSVPVTPTGQPWSTQLYWWLASGMGIVALALIECARRRFVFDRRRSAPGA